MKVTFQNGYICVITPIPFDEWSKCTGRTATEDWEYFLSYNGFVAPETLNLNMPHTMEKFDGFYSTALDYDNKDTDYTGLNPLDFETSNTVKTGQDVIKYVNTEFKRDKELLDLDGIFLSANLGVDCNVNIVSNGLKDIDILMLLTSALDQHVNKMKEQHEDEGI